MMASRCRTSNFSLKERCVFIELLVQNYPFLHEEKGHSKSNNDIRSTAWNDLTNEFHFQLADKNTYRTTKQLKTLYENIKHKIKRNIGQGSMQADVKTAKDIPLSLFMQLKTQYEAEMGKMAATDNSGYESRSYATGRDYGAVATEAGKSCENREFPAGHQECGAGCKCRSYSNIPSSKHHKKSSEGHGFKAHKHVEKWVNSKGDRIVILDKKTVLMEDYKHGADQPRESIVLTNLPSGIGVRHPRNLSKNIYNLSDSSEDEQLDTEENVGDDSMQESNNTTMASCDKGFLIRIGNQYNSSYSIKSKEGTHDVRNHGNSTPHNGNRNSFDDHSVNMQSNGNQMANNGGPYINEHGNKRKVVNQYVRNADVYNNQSGNQMSIVNQNGQTGEQYRYQYDTHNMNQVYQSGQNGTGGNQHENQMDTENQNVYNGDQYDSQISIANQYVYKDDRYNNQHGIQTNVNPNANSGIQNNNHTNNVSCVNTINQLNIVNLVNKNGHNAVLNKSHDEEVTDDEEFETVASTSDDMNDGDHNVEFRNGVGDDCDPGQSKREPGEYTNWLKQMVDI